jgi:hypothetical protein
VFDASLQPGRMQAQVKLAAALTDYAARHPRPSGPAGGTRLQAAGDDQPNRVFGHPDEVDEQTWAAATAGVRTLIDRLFRRDVDKRQIAALWAAGRYRESPT